MKSYQSSKDFREIKKGTLVRKGEVTLLIGENIISKYLQIQIFVKSGHSLGNMFVSNIRVILIF